MGGCYSYGESSCSRSRYDSKASVKKTLKKFFETKDIELLTEAYKDYEDLGFNSGFFRFLMEYQGVDEAPKEFSDTEIESKLEILLVNTNKKFKKEPEAEKILDALEFPPTKSAQYIKDAVNKTSTGNNSFFGTDDGEEKFVIIEKCGGWYLKEKGPVEDYNYGIPGEQIVLRRKESRVPTDPLKVAQTLMEKYADKNIRYQGTITKTKSDAFFINTSTGRMYGVTVSDSKVDNRRQLQLELEYAGYIPGFDIDLDNERSIVEDIVNINKQVLLLYNDIKIARGWKVQFRPTCERKYDFVLGNAKSLPEPKLETMLALPGTTPQSVWALSEEDAKEVYEEALVR